MRMVQVATIAVVLAMLGSVRLSGVQAFPLPSGSKTGQQIPGLPQGGKNNPADPDSSPLDPHREEKQAELRNTDRQKRLVADTDKLLALATDLKAQVDKSTKDTLSVDVIKKADEIEKLAHSVKERMKG